MDWHCCRRRYEIQSECSWNGWQLYVELLEQFLGLTEALTISGVTYTTTSAYNDRGELTSLTYPDSTVVDREYTDRGELYRLKHASTVIDTRGYDDGGRMTSSAYNNGVSESRSYGTDNTLSSISFTGASIGNLSYAWDDNKNKTAETIAGTMSGYGFSVGSSGYDNEDRLVNFNRTDGNLDQSWSLSNVGDWNSVTTEGTAQSRTHGPTHELTAVAGSSVSADVNGNITLIPAAARPSAQSLLLNWDFDNRLSTADVGNNSSVDVTYKFDALGRRVYRQDSSSTTVYVQAGQQTIADYVSGTAASSPTYRYVYASYIDEPVFRYKPTGSESIYFHRNQQYSIIALTNGSGSIVERYAYSAYGVPTIADSSGSVLTSSAYSNRYTYTGREWDPVLLMYHYRARMYDANLGRFCSRDPIGYYEGLSLYRAFFAPNELDPTGLKCVRQVCCRYRLGWLIPQFTTKELDCELGRPASQCCDDFGQIWYRLWRTDASFDGKCKRTTGPKVTLALIPPTTTNVPHLSPTPSIPRLIPTPTPTPTPTPAPVPSPTSPVLRIHPLIIVCVGVVIANKCFINDQDLDIPEEYPAKCWETYIADAALCENPAVEDYDKCIQWAEDKLRRCTIAEGWPDPGPT